MKPDLSRTPRPLCFVLMPFGRKSDPAGGPDIDFDGIYERAIAPAIRDAGLDPLRADHEVTGGIIHKVMFERLLLCEFALADLTTANANVFYELGVRHAARPRTTLTIFAEHQPIPFDLRVLRAVPYQLGASNAFGADQAAALRATLTRRLSEVRARAHEQSAPDSPLVELLQGYQCPEVAHLRTALFQEQVQYAEEIRRQLVAARTRRPLPAAQAELAAIEAQLPPLDAVEAGAVIDLYLSYRAVEDFDRMLALHERMPEVLRRTVMVREQLAFALNRKAARLPAGAREPLREQAVRILEVLIDERGPDPESCGLLGRVFKDRWDDLREGEPARARGFLRRAIKEYSRGFAADPRDAFPGVNAVTLLDQEGTPASLAERDRLIPVVRYAVERRCSGKQPDYWDQATLLELAVLTNDRPAAEEHLLDALGRLQEPWEGKTTARNLGLIYQARQARQEDAAWIAPLMRALEGSGG